ncbi:Secreted repeat of unknown function [Bacillus sp. OV194]|nr:Secreted repeat of unknown function [Bacillus sp. OV194]
MRKLIIFVCVFMAIMLLAACNSGQKTNSSNNNSAESSKENAKNNSDSQTGLKLMEKKPIGKYLADEKGMTLYYFKKDQPGLSNCKDDCLNKWPVFYEENLDIPEGFNKSDFETITRQDTNEQQTTFKGYPLYYFVKDKAKGDVNGQGVMDVWYTLNSDTTFKQ